MHISPCFPANDITCCLFDMHFRTWNDVRQKQIELFEFKMGPKAVETTLTPSNGLEPYEQQ